MLILDIGCGVKKVAGAIGIDFSSLSDADVVINLNHERLPFDDSSVDFIYLSHTLKHLSFDGFFHVMSESYRILKPCADFKSVVQNFTTSVNLVNPFHNKNICFSERTFRFFSSEFPKHTRHRAAQTGGLVIPQIAKLASNSRRSISTNFIFHITWKRMSQTRFRHARRN